MFKNKVKNVNLIWIKVKIHQYLPSKIDSNKKYHSNIIPKNIYLA